MLIGIISDTHTYFDDKLRHFLKDCDELWHAGDIGSVECADQISSFKKMVAVYGNIDNSTLRLMFPQTNIFEREGLKIVMTHIGGYPRHYDFEAEKNIIKHNPDIFISGHSHILKVINDQQYNLLHINPGAAGNVGFHRVRTAIRLEITNGKIASLEVGEWDR